MAATKRAYRSLGYEVVCRIPDFYAPSDDKLILQNGQIKADRKLAEIRKD